jgi:hypothetical protein
MEGLPSKDYFLKTLDRPHYANEGGKAAPQQKPSQKPGQQVRNEAPVVAAKNE